MDLLFRLSKDVEGFENIANTRNFFKNELQSENNNYFYNNVRQFQYLNKNETVYFIYDNLVVATANYDKKTIIDNERYFKVGHKLSNIKVIYNNERFDTNIIGTRTTYVDSTEKKTELKRVLDNNFKMKTIATTLNKLSINYEIGKLQKLRKEILKIKRPNTKSIFSDKTIHEDWAFHSGGRSELQFNIGFENNNGTDILRYGVAFSLAKSQSLTDINDLLPKVELFNEYILEKEEQFSDLKMWYYENGKRSIKFKPTPIDDNLFKEKNFIFLGSFIPISKLDYEKILEIFDRLLPLYLFTMGDKKDSNKSTKFKFKKGNSSKKSSTKMSKAKLSLNINLIHNQLQERLFDKLCQKYGKDNVGTENSVGIGSIDLVVKRSNNEFWFYEIKTYKRARLCIREALGQLLEYSYWHTDKKVTKLIVVGRAKLDKETKEYIKTLNSKFDLNLEYMRIEKDTTSN